MPLDRLNEGVDNLKKIAKKLPKKKLRVFANKLITMNIEKIWIGKLDPKTWNMYQHRGVTTNNNAEAFNSKMAGKKKISRHPNPYVFTDVIRETFIQSLNFFICTGRLEWAYGEFETPEELVKKMKIETEFGDHIFLQFIAAKF